jgi:hypothetical protein
MALGLPAARHKRAHEADDYGMAEREQQYQYEFSGQAGVLPAEIQLTINFGVVFPSDHGNQRDSTLDRPQVGIGFETEYGPAGLIPYAHVSEWIQDVDFNYTGAKMTVGVHCPAVAIEGLNVSQARFKLALHVGFQGRCSVVDPDGALDAGGDDTLPDQTPGVTG